MTAQVRIGALASEVGLHPNWLRQLADRGEIPSARTKGGHRVFDVADVRAALAQRALTRAAGAPGGSTAGRASFALGAPDWTTTLELAGLEEDRVWLRLVDESELDRLSPVGRLMSYPFTEMLNNAIDHSYGTEVQIRFWANDAVWAFQISDNGVGAFASLQQGLQLPDVFSAVQELSKGKRTTAPDRHSGEGIFFTSKMADVFQLAANGLRWTADNLRQDQALGTDQIRQGTLVFVQVDTHTTKVPAEIFRQFTEDLEFVRTRPAVKLFEVGVTFVSRSEARRILDGLEDFTEVQVDFAGVEDVGQGFVDEMVRVWPAMHPDKTVTAININPAVEFMVHRGLRSRPSEPTQ